MHISYPALFFLGIMHIAGAAAVPYLWMNGVSGPEIAFHLLAYPIGGLGITALYHRAWAHNAVQYARPVEYLLALGSVPVLQMPAKQWISSHIKHHNHTDHEDDPYNIQLGFWWAHMEWIILAPLPPVELPERLRDNPVVEWQDKYYWPLFGLLNLVLPVLISLAVGAPWWGGLLVSGLRLVVTSHIVYSVNSVCHKWGTRKFTHDVSARDVWWFPFALGEQYHNYHHAFPKDYRHGIRRFDFDPTKWFIQALAKVGLARNLFQMPEKRIRQAMESVRPKEAIQSGRNVVVPAE